MLRRMLAAIPTLVGVSLLAFVLIRWVPGDPVSVLIGDRGASPEAIAQIRSNLGLDRPLVEQYFLFIGRAVRGDLGQSIITRRGVWDEFKDRFPATVELSLVALFWAVLIGVPLGAMAAVWRGGWVDRIAMSTTLVGYSMPIFWWGLILILIFSIFLGWTPVAGRMSALTEVEARSGFLLIDVWLTGSGWPAFKEALRHLILPSIALGTVPLAAIARMTRSSTLEVLKEDYIRTARAKGLSGFQVIAKHALANALIPIVTVIGLMGSSLLTGAILTETIFAWPGIGKWLVHSVSARDYPVIQGALLLICVMIMVVNLLVDLIYVWVNPMIRSSHD